MSLEFGGPYCTERPVECTGGGDSVCGCDGKVYPSECDAHLAGVDIGASGDCEPPGGYFACGPRFCAVGDYCETFPFEGATVTSACKPIPARCEGPPATPPCLCAQNDSGCSGECSTDADGNVLVVCTH